MKLGTEQIKELIPHREPFLFLDSVLEIEKGRMVKAEKLFSPEEFFFRGHFPGNPVVPGVILAEAMAQAGGVLFKYSFGKEVEEKGFDNAYLMGLDCCRFRTPVVPGNRVVLEVELVRRRSRVMFFSAVAFVDGKKVAEGEISAWLV
ncbi:MAG: 3-hydroxyacyl-ACP dehydratase FabZ [Candidatus Dadabacteria bacterium]|nr:3-hydroxyacyl-ACP dehydratase FabZ [Candidatus Dadabacteria bacterium]